MTGLVLQGRVNWSGEHWISYLRRPGASADCGMVSLYNMRYTEAGHGFVAFVVIDDGDGPAFKGLCTDNRELADFVRERVVRRASHPPYGEELPVLEARFTQGGHVTRDPSWTIAAGGREITARWEGIQPVVIAAGPWPGDSASNYVCSLLHFAEESSITLDGRAVAGRPYLRDIWRPSIGGDRSSCVFAISESLLTVELS